VSGPRYPSLPLVVVEMPLVNFLPQLMR